MGRFCKNCGTENMEGTQFCVACGTPLGSQEESGYAPQYQQPMQQPMQQAVPQAQPTNSMFVSADEYVVATLKNGIVSNLMSGEGLRNEEAVLTNRRLYYNHTDGFINIKREEEKINVADITGTKILDNNPRGMLVIAALLFLGMLLTGEGEAIFMGVIAALVAVVIYFINVKKHFRIEYSGGHIYFSIKKYNMKTVREFQKAIYMVKDTWV